MAGRQKALEFLRRTVSPAADKALALAMSRADDATARAIIETLLLRNTREAMMGLVSSWHRVVGVPLREQILAHEEGLFGVLREVMSSTNERERTNAVEVIRDGRFYRAAYLLEAGLRDRSTAVRDSAAGALYFLAEILLDTPPADEVDLMSLADPADVSACMIDLENRQEDRRQLASAVEAGLSSFDVHHQPPVVHAAMWCIDDLASRFWKILSVPGSRAIRAAQNILARNPDVRLIPFMMQALNYAEFRPLITQTLGTCTDASFLTEWFRQSWRLRQPKTARGLTTVHELASTKNQLLDIITMPDEAQRHFSRSVSVMGLPEQMKVGILKEMHRRAQPVGRRAAVWALAELSREPSAITVLRSIAAGDHAESAWIAACELTRRRPSEYPVSALLERRISITKGRVLHTLPATPPEYWAAFDRLTEDERLRSGKRLLSNPRVADSIVNAGLASSDPDDRLRGLRIITVLDFAHDFEPQICRLCHDPNPEVRSAAVAALGRVSTPTSKRVLQTTLYDSNPRVQANSVEALDRIGGVSTGRELIPKLSSPDNRTRANAVLALVKLGIREAAETLLAMLEDPNPAHRVSGLWLVDQMRLLPLVERVVRIAATDEDEQVRGRARSLSERLVAEPQPARVPSAAVEVPA